jgi:hypothetical protein
MTASPQVLLRVGYGLVPIVAGADKFANRLTDWEKYLWSPRAITTTWRRATRC